MEHQLHVVQSRITPGIADTILNSSAFLNAFSFIRVFITPNTQKPHRLKSGEYGTSCDSAHFVDNFLSVVASWVIHMHSQLDRPFSPAHILLMLLLIRQHKAYEMILSECIIWIKVIDAYQAFVPEKDSDHHFCSITHGKFLGVYKHP
jgi:hypothetical protein